MIINGNLNLANSIVESLGELKEVHGSLDLNNCRELTDLGKLEKIEVNEKKYMYSLNFSNLPKLKSLGLLKSINWIQRFLIVNCPNLTSLGELKWFPVNEVNLQASNIKRIKSYSGFVYTLDLSENKFIQVIEEGVSVGFLNLRNSSIKKIDKQCTFKILNIENCINLKSLGRNLRISEKLKIDGSGITEKYLKKYHPELLKVLIK